MPGEGDLIDQHIRLTQRLEQQDVDEEFGQLLAGDQAANQPAGPQGQPPSASPMAEPPAPAVAPTTAGDGDDDEGGILDTAGAVLSDVAGGAVESGTQVVGGLADALNELGDTIAQAKTDLGIGRVDIDFDDDGSILPNITFQSAEEREADIEAGDIGFRFPTTKDPDTVTGQFVRSTSQFMAVFLPGMKVTKGMTAGIRGLQALSSPAVRSVAAGAMADFLAFDPHDQRLSTFLNQNPWLEPVVSDYLADNDPNNESFWEGKLKNTIEGGALGLSADFAMRLFKYAKVKRASRKVERQAAELAANADAVAVREADRIAAQADIVPPLEPDALVGLGDEFSDQLLLKIDQRKTSQLDRLPASVSLTQPNTPTVEQMKQFSRVESVPLKSARGFQASRWDLFNAGEHPGSLIDGYGDMPVAVKRRDGEYLIYDGNHRTVRQLNAGADRMDMHVIDAQDYAPDMAGRPKAKEKMTDDELLEALGNPAPDEAKRGTASPATKPNKVFINHARINTEDDVKQLIQDAADLGADDIKSPEYQSNLESIAQSEREYTDLSDLLGRDPKPMNAAEALASRRILVASGEQVAALAEKVTSNTATAADIYAFRRATAVHHAIQSEVIAARRETARALQSWSIPQGSDKARADAINELIMENGGPADIIKFAHAVRHIADNPGAINQAINKSFQGKLTDALFEIWVNGLLSSPKTHLVNALSNGLVALWQIPERALAAGIDTAFYNGDITAGEVGSMLYGQMRGIREGWRMASKVQRLDDQKGVSDLLEHFGKLEKPRTPSLSSDAFQMSGPVASEAVDMIGAAVRTPGTLLERADMFFKAISYRGELYAQAHRKGVAQGLEGNDLAEAIARYISDPPEDMVAIALDAAQTNTFTKPLGEGAQKFNAFTNWVDGKSRFPVTRFVVPFRRTPVNILKFTFARTPLAPLSAGVRADIAEGGARAAQAYARIGMGTMAMMTVADYVNEGVITGNGPTDDTQRRNWLQAGHQPYSIKWGDKWYRYNRLEPIGMLFGMASDIAEIVHESADGELVLTAGIVAFSQNFASKTWTQGIFDAFAMFDPDNFRSDPGKYFVDFIGGSTLPFSSLLRNYAMAEDTVMRDTRVSERDDLHIEAMGDLPKPVFETMEALIRKARASVPGYSKGLKPRLDVWGEPIDRASGLGFLYDFLSPVQAKPIKNDPVSQMIYENKIKVSKPQRTIGGVPLSADEYHDYAEISGKMAKQQLDVMVGSPGFSNLSGGPDGMKASIVEDIIRSTRAAARSQLMLSRPDLRNAVIQRQQNELLQLQGVAP